MANTIFKPKISSSWKHIFDPNKSDPNRQEQWYTNDHAFIKGIDGKWHAYGCIGYLPPNPWEVEKQLFHISAGTLCAENWEEHEYALVAEPEKEAVVWAPYIFKHGDEFTMLYAGGNRQKGAHTYASWGTMHLAKSKDLFNWARDCRNPIFSDPGHARDPRILKDGNYYYIYYTTIFSENDLRSSVAVRKSKDLIHFSGPLKAHVHQNTDSYCGCNTESPSVVKYNGLFYLFTAIP